ncbi:uncharacterized protein LOC134501210 [Candoia aspera]|uniref:uncharacterized protein LOC134501210 n=1 Tax=Candoia aspera TaxID=51853 RepID=UPI002FD85B70
MGRSYGPPFLRVGEGMGAREREQKPEVGRQVLLRAEVCLAQIPNSQPIGFPRVREVKVQPEGARTQGYCLPRAEGLIGGWSEKPLWPRGTPLVFPPPPGLARGAPTSRGVVLAQILNTSPRKKARGSQGALESKDVGMNYAEEILLDAAHQKVWPKLFQHGSPKHLRKRTGDLTVAGRKLPFHKKQAYLTETQSNRILYSSSNVQILLVELSGWRWARRECLGKGSFN